MELVHYWKIVRKSLWLTVVLVIISVGLAAVYTLRQPAKYDSSATLLLNPAVPNSLVPYIKTELAPNIADSYTALIHTQSFAESVIKELPFSSSPSQVAGSISTELIPNTLFYKISARMDRPDRAQQLVATVVKVFLSANAAQQAESNKSADATKNDVRTRLESKLQYLGDQIKNYQAKIAALDAQPPTSARDDQLLQLQGQLVNLQQSETDALVAMASISDSTSTDNTALVIDQPQLGSRVPSDLSTNIGLAFVSASVLGLALAFFRDSLDYSVQSSNHVEEILGMTPVAMIGVISGADKKRASRSPLWRWKPAVGVPFLTGDREKRSSVPVLTTLYDPGSPQSESFREMRTNIQFSSVDKPIRSLVITSCGVGEGKTFTAANLAVVMAQAGRRVILVDADLRNPEVHKMFDLRNSTGFTNLIYDKATTLAMVVQPVASVKNLAIITAGILPSNPSELLNTQQSAKVMSQLAQQADIVIYDSPPAGIVTDAIILAARADAVVLVVASGSTRRDTLGRLRQSLRNVGAVALLPVLNRVRDRDSQGRYVTRHYRVDSSRPAYPTWDGSGSPAPTNGKALHEDVDKHQTVPMD